MEAAFFDLDRTLISRSSSFALTRPMYQAGMVSRRTVLRGAYAQLVFRLLGSDDPGRMDRAKEALLALTKGWDQAKLESIVAEVVTATLEPFVYEEALDLIAEHRAAGREVVVVSSAPEEVVAPLASALGATSVIGTRAEVEDGRYTGRLAFYCYGPGKALAMQELATQKGIDLAASFAYSDSDSDLPMLHAVGHPFAVNPSRALRHAAEANGWPIVKFQRPVPMRGPGAAMRSGPGIAAIVTAAAAAVVVTVWVVRRRHLRASLA